MAKVGGKMGIKIKMDFSTGIGLICGMAVFHISTMKEMIGYETILIIMGFIFIIVGFLKYKTKDDDEK